MRLFAGVYHLVFDTLTDIPKSSVTVSALQRSYTHSVAMPMALPYAACHQKVLPFSARQGNGRQGTWNRVNEAIYLVSGSQSEAEFQLC